MNNNTESAIAIISAIFVMFTAMIDTQASFVVALVALICFVVYKLSFRKQKVEMPAGSMSKMAKKQRKTKKKTTRSKR